MASEYRYVKRELDKMADQSRRTGQPVTETFEGIQITIDAGLAEVSDLKYALFLKLKAATTQDERDAAMRSYLLSRTIRSVGHLNFKDQAAVLRWLNDYVPCLLHPAGAEQRQSVLDTMKRKLNISRLPGKVPPPPQGGSGVYNWQITSLLVQLRDGISS